MEQYIHTLIAVDPAFAPDPARVTTFFEGLISQQKLHPISDIQRSLPGLAVAKPSGRSRWMTNQYTGEKMSFIDFDRWNLEQLEAVPALIESSDHYTVIQSGQWTRDNRPISLYKTDGCLFDENYICTVRCELRPEAVSTSAWDLEAGPNLRDVPDFGSACNAKSGLGIFPNPWTGAAIEVADAGCARFWIEFEFGRFIYPRVNGDLEIMDSTLVTWAEHSFQTKFAQGCRFW